MTKFTTGTVLLILATWSFGCGRVDAGPKAIYIKPKGEAIYIQGQPGTQVAPAAPTGATFKPDTIEQRLDRIEAILMQVAKDRQDLATSDACYDKCRKDFNYNWVRDEDGELVPDDPVSKFRQEHCDDECRKLPRPPGGC